jgi:hypothetical protein
MKTNARQRAVLSGLGKVNWRSSPTKKTESVDKLLMENWQVVAAAHAGGINQRVLTSKSQSPEEQLTATSR